MPPHIIGAASVFPPELADEGLSRDVLFSTLEQLKTGCTDRSWKLHDTPTIGFYRHLHTYLKSQHNLSKVLIGRLYSAIDCNFKEKGSRPDNTYRFVENIVASERQSDVPMLYNIPVIRSTSSMLKQSSQKIQELNVECTKLRKKVEASHAKLRATNHALRDITDQNHQLEKKCELSKAKASKLKDRNAQLETECALLFQELEEESDSDTSFHAVDEPTPALQDILGHRKYSPEIRKLYCSLLADQAPASKIAEIIKTVSIPP